MSEDFQPQILKNTTGQILLLGHFREEINLNKMNLVDFENLACVILHNFDFSP